MPLLPGPPAIEINLRKSARATRFSLRISRLDGRVTLSMPLRAAERDAMRFAAAQEGWIRRTLARLPLAAPLAAGAMVPVEGRMLQLSPGGAGRAVRIEGDSLLIPGPETAIAAKAAAFLKVLARDRLARASDHYAGLLGRPYTRLTLRDTRSRWGSCAPDGALMYSWRLIMAPPEVLEYVAAHEVAHLEEMNHSPAFWRVVGRLYPDWKRQRAWLQEHGQGLHSFRFSAQPTATED